MAGPTKFRFPLPHRRHKHHQEVQSISAPMTNKAQKVLGNGELNIDVSPPIVSSDPRPWETRSTVSGISVSISETATPASIAGSRSPLTTVGEHKAWDSGHNGTAWEQESEIIPKGLGIRSGGNLDTITDASSVRRRQSSSTIASYYDKAKLPLSISQQTSNSAMAKGLPNKAMELLNMEASAAPPPKPESRRKASKLDFAHLLPSAAASSRSALSKMGRKGNLVLGSDMMTKSPSLLSLSQSSDMAPSPIEKKLEKTVRKKLTKESLRSTRPESQQQQRRVSTQSSASSESVSSNLRKRATETGTLYRLYEHYEHNSTMNTQEPGRRSSSRLSGTQAEMKPVVPSRQSFQSGLQTVVVPLPAANKKHYTKPSVTAVSRQPYSSYSPDVVAGKISEVHLPAMTSPVDLMSPPDYAGSVYSRHTRVSKASKRTDQSFTDFDPQMNSILSLSSDSEEDFPEPPRTARSTPSLTSRDSVASTVDMMRSNPQLSTPEPSFLPAKSKFRTSMSPKTYFLAIPENMKAPVAAPKINLRTSSLSGSVNSTYSRPEVAASISTTGSSSVRSPSRLSIMSSSTVDSIASQLSRPVPTGSAKVPSPEIRHIVNAMVPRAAPSGYPQANLSADQQKRSSKEYFSHISQTNQPTPPLSPSSMEFFIRSQHNSFDYSGPSVTLMGPDSTEDERFMAVTRQEETLLAAMRAKRALMRESLGAEERVQTAGDKTASKKESCSSIKTVKNKLQPQPLNLRPRASDSGSAKTVSAGALSSTSRSGSRQSDGTAGVDVLMFLDRTISTMNEYDMAEPSPAMSDFVNLDSQDFPLPPTFNTAKAPKPMHTRTPSGQHMSPLQTAQQNQASSHPRPDSESVPNLVSPSQKHMFRSTENLAARPRDQSADRASPKVQRPELSIFPRPDSRTSDGRTRKASLRTVGSQFVNSPSVGNPPRISAVGRPELSGGLWDDEG